MKKFILGLLLVIVAIGGFLYVSGYFDSGEVTEADSNAADEISQDQELIKALENAGGEFSDAPAFEEDTTLNEEEEEFDPEAML